MVAILVKELKEMMRDGRIKIVAIISLILLVISSITGINQYQKKNKQYAESTSKERTIWETQEEKNPHSAAHYGTYVFKPKFALSVFDYGVTTYTGNSIFIEAHNQNEASFSEATDQTSLARFGTLSINFVLLYLFPLLVILLGYNTYTKEKEQQTLLLIKSQGIAPLKLVLGKWLATFLPILILTTLVFLTVGVVLTQLEDLVFFNWAKLWTLLVLYLCSTLLLPVSLF